MSTLSYGFTVDVDYSDIAGWFYGIAEAQDDVEVRREQEDDPDFLKDYANNDYVTGRVYLFTYRHPQLHPTVGVLPIKFDANGTPLDASAEVGGGPGTGSNGTPNLDAVAKVGNTTTEILNIGGLSLPDPAPSGDFTYPWPLFRRAAGRLELFLTSYEVFFNKFTESFSLRLRDLKEFIAPQNIVITDAQETVSLLVGVLDNLKNKLGIRNHRGRSIHIEEDKIVLSGASVEAPGAPITARSYVAETLAVAPGEFIPCVWELVDGKYALKSVSMTQYALSFVPQLLPYLNGSGGSDYQLEYLGCVDAVVDPSPYEKRTITPDLIGDTLQHNLQLTGDKIWITAQRMDGTPANNDISVAFSGTENYVVTYADESITNLTIKLMLEPFNP